jgi:hypothetical protein
MSRVSAAIILLALGGPGLAQTGEPTPPATGATQQRSAQPAGTVQEPDHRRQPSLEQPPPANPGPLGGTIGGPVQETGRYDSLGQGAATGGSAGEPNQRPLVEPDYRRSDPQGGSQPRP